MSTSSPNPGSAPPPAPQHFTLPFDWRRQPDLTVAAASNDQDSVADVTACVEAIVRTMQGERDALPTFGRPAILFDTDEQGAVTDLRQAIDAHEDRVQSLVELDLDDVDPALWHLRAMYQIGPDQGDQT